MELFTSELGNKKEIIIKDAEEDKGPSVYYNNEEFIISLSFLGFAESDKKEFLDNYELFKRVYGDIRSVYEKKDFQILKKFITIVLNNRNFQVTICNKAYMFAKLLFIVLNGKNNYKFAGYSTLTISDISKMKDELIYPLIYACKNPSNESFKELLIVLRDCPCYYLPDSRNTFKENVRKLLWRKNYKSYQKALYDLDLDDPESYNQIFTSISLASATSRLNVDTDNDEFAIKNMIMYHNNKSYYDEGWLKKMCVPFFKKHYIDKDKNPILQIVEDINYILFNEFNRMIDIFRNNGDYNNQHFKFISHFFNTITQVNCEFQVAINEWALLMGVMDLCKENISPYYYQSHVIDFLILSHYTRTCEYLKNHGEEGNAPKVLKTRV